VERYNPTDDAPPAYDPPALDPPAYNPPCDTDADDYPCRHGYTTPYRSRAASGGCSGRLKTARPPHPPPAALLASSRPLRGPLVRYAPTDPPGDGCPANPTHRATAVPQPPRQRVPSPAVDGS